MVAIVGLVLVVVLAPVFRSKQHDSAAIERPLGVTIGRVCSITPSMDFSLCGIKQTGDAHVSLELKIVKPEHFQVLESNLIKQSTCVFRYTGMPMGYYGELISVEPATLNER